VCYAHDEGNISKSGDLVEIEESPPLSKLKRWVLKRVVTKARQTGPEIAEVEGASEQPTKE
jgi:small subunit ribosomal protein S17